MSWEKLEDKPPYIVQQYSDKLNLTNSFLKNKKILDMGCEDGSFIKYLLDKKITKEAYGLDIEDGSNNELCDYTLLINKKHFLHQSFDDSISLKNIDLIIFKSAFYPPMIPNSINIFKQLVENNLSENGEIRVEIAWKENSPELLRNEWQIILSKLKSSGLKYLIDYDKELLIIKK